MTLQQIVSGPLLRYLKSDFTTISQKWSPYWVDVSRATFGSLPWRSRSQHDLAAKSCPAHNFVIWSRILQLFHRNDHHIETMFRAQHLGCFYTLNFVCDITLTLLEVYLPVSNTYSGSITRFNRLLFNEEKWQCRQLSSSILPDNKQINTLNNKRFLHLRRR
jgi:hypothetical protein